jgi:ABC-type lipoprotein release transport system permease subunit
MAKLTIGFGVVLILLGAWGFIGTGSTHPTALIPAYFGLVLGIAGALAITENAKRRMLWMHVAVTVGLLGFLGAGARAIVELVKAHGAPLADAVAVAVRFQLAMAVICLVFVLLCVRSFIAARRGGKLAG